MPDPDKYETLVLGNSEAGKYLAWTMAKEGHRNAMDSRPDLIGVDLHDVGDHLIARHWERPNVA